MPGLFGGRSRPEGPLPLTKARSGLWFGVLAQAAELDVGSLEFEVGFCRAVDLGAAVFADPGLTLLAQEIRDYRSLMTQLTAWFRHGVSSGWVTLKPSARWKRPEAPVLRRTRPAEFFSNSLRQSGEDDVFETCARLLIDVTTRSPRALPLPDVALFGESELRRYAIARSQTPLSVADLEKLRADALQTLRNVS